MALSKSVMRNVARFRIRGHGLKCETGLYGRSPDRSARVCNLCENGDYIQDEKHVIFLCIGTEHLRHQFIHLFDNNSEGDIKGFVFQHNSEVYKFITVPKFNHPAPQKKIFSFANPQPIRTPFNIYYNLIRRPF